MRTKIASALGIVYVVWGSTYFAIAVADRTLPPLLMLAARFALAGGLLYGWSAWPGEVAAARPGPREWTAAAIVRGPLPLVDPGRACPGPTAAPPPPSPPPLLPPHPLSVPPPPR